MKLTPTRKQLEFMDWELGLFLHFGIRTFYPGYQDWDRQPMDPVAFNPTALDCRQWVSTAREAGMKYAVLTAKHHDGFANWPTAFSDYSVTASPWKAGHGDVVREFVAACAEYDVHPGLYYSPADYSLELAGEQYDEYFLNQITELLSNYGQIDIIWFDGNGSGGHVYDWSRIIATIRKLQPGIRIFNMGDPDIRWVGNEVGLAPASNWNEVDSLAYSIVPNDEEALASGNRWLPAECDIRMRAVNWFYSDDDENTVKSLPELLGLYEYSVGRGANLLINIGPDRRGLLPNKDRDRLLEFGREIARRYRDPLATIADFTKQDNRYIWRGEKPSLVNQMVIGEDLTHGQAVKQFTISTEVNGQEIILLAGQTIGHKRICSFPLLSTANLIVDIAKSEGNVRLRDIKLFRI